MRSGRLAKLDAIAFRIGDPAEAADPFRLLRLLGDVRSVGAQLREHRIQVADPEVEHGLLGAGPEIVGFGSNVAKTGPTRISSRTVEDRLTEAGIAPAGWIRLRSALVARVTPLLWRVAFHAERPRSLREPVP